MNSSTARICLGLLLSIQALRVLGQSPAYTNAIGMAFVLIQPGGMVVGRFQPPYPARPASDKGIADNKRGLAWSQNDYRLAEKLVKQDARPGFSVAINRPYYIGKFEVTQGQWKQVMKTNPSAFQGNKVKDDADQHPVENVTWQDARQFLAKLNALDKEHHYRLPTEFEWEYAARAGASDDIAWKDIQAAAQLGMVTTGRVGQKAPNAWGVYDTLGNVWEWVQDCYNGQLFADPSTPSDPSPRSGKQHVLKGASFMGDVKNATYMTHAAGPGNGWDIGFRVVLDTN